MKTTFKILLIFIGLSISAKNYAQEAEIVQKKYATQLEKLIKTKKVKAAFEIIEQNDAQTIQEMIQLTEVLAPPFKEKERATKYAEMLNEAGADSVWIDEVGNVIALRKGVSGHHTVALDAHLDTVFPENTDVSVKKKGILCSLRV